MEKPSSPSQAGIQGLIIDMDGVLWEGETPLPGLAGFFNFLRTNNVSFVLATNNASRTPEEYQKKLARMGAHVEGEKILTSAVATGHYLESIAKPGQKVFVIGEDALRQAVLAAGLTPADENELHADFVICGMDRALTWEKLGNAAINIRNGARFIGTNSDSTFPTERGLTHGNGAILAALTTATEITPIIIGKPYLPLYQMAMEKLPLPPEKISALGDRLETDILGAQNIGIRSILVLSGVTSRIQLAESEIKPTWTFPDLISLQNNW
jgi:4-nitrophenyl phosphatase